MQHANSTIFSASNTSANSAAFDAQYLMKASFQAVFSDGAAAGTVKIQCSNDNLSPTNWSDVPNASQVVASGATVLIPAIDMCYRWIRVSWTKTGGAGTIVVTVNSINI